MSHTHILCAIGAISWCLAASAAQSPAPPVVLSPELRAHVKAERFQVVTSLRGLPLGVRDALQALFGNDGPGIAEPGAEFQSSGETATSHLPLRRLVAAGCSYEHCLVYYERGGEARAWRAVLLHWTPDATRVDWGGVAPRGLRSIEDVQNVVVSGGTQASVNSW